RLHAHRTRRVLLVTNGEIQRVWSFFIEDLDTPRIDRVHARLASHARDSGSAEIDYAAAVDVDLVATWSKDVTRFDVHLPRLKLGGPIAIAVPITVAVGLRHHADLRATNHAPAVQHAVVHA